MGMRLRLKCISYGVGDQLTEGKLKVVFELVLGRGNWFRCWTTWYPRRSVNETRHRSSLPQRNTHAGMGLGEG